MASNLGKVFVELSLDDKTFKQQLSGTLTSTQATAKGIETAWRALGVQSDASFSAQRRAAENAYTLIKNNALSTSQDIIRAEQAKAAKIVEINRQQNGEVAKNHESSMAGMMRGVLRLYAAYYVLSSGIQGVTGFIRKGIEAIDSMKISVTSVAAQITTMQGTTGNVLENYKQNLVYAKSLIPVLEQMDVNSYANLEQLQKMNMAMSLQGVLLDTNNQKQIETFTALSNAVAMFTQGQDKEKQAAQEIRALFSGQVRQGNAVAMMIDQMIKKTGEYKNGLKGLVEEGKKHGDTLERLYPYLIGIVAASGDINKTWEAAKATLETTYNKVLREGFQTAYNDIITQVHLLSDWAKQHKAELATIIEVGWNVIKTTVDWTATGVMKVYDATVYLKTELAAVAAILSGMAIVSLLNTTINLVIKLGTVVAALGVRIWAALGPIPLAIAGIVVAFERLGRTEAVDAQITRLERLKIEAQRTGIGLSDINTQLDKLRARQGTMATATPGYAVGTETYMNAGQAAGVPKMKTGTGTDEGAAKAAQSWKDLQDEYNLKLVKTNDEMSKWEKQIAQIDHDYDEALKKASRVDNPLPVSREWLNDWKASMKAIVDSNIAKEIAKINNEAIENDRKTQYERTMLYLTGANERYSIERKNQIDIMKIRAQWGVETERNILEAERDFQIGSLNEQADIIKRQMEFMAESAGYSQTDEKSVKEQLRLWNELQKVLTQIGTTRELFATQLADKERKGMITTLETLKSIYAYIPGAAEEAYAIEIALIKEKAALMNNGFVDQATIAKWAAMEQEKAMISAGKASSSVIDGMSAGFAEYARNAEKHGEHMASLVTQSLDGISNSLSDLVVKGKADWESLMETIASSLAKMAIQDYLIGPLAKMIGFPSASGGGAGGASTGLIGMIAKYFGTSSTLAPGYAATAGGYTYMDQGSEAWGSTMTSSAEAASTNIVDSSQKFSSTVASSGQAFGQGMVGMVPVIGMGIMAALGVAGGSMSTGSKMLTGAMSGAMMGSYFGPWGAAAGAVIGAAASMFHEGGRVGTEGRRVMVNPAVFANAPRAHTGLGPKERAVVMNEDETVFTPGQMKALGALINTKRGTTTVNINVAGSVWQEKSLARELVPELKKAMRAGVH